MKALSKFLSFYLASFVLAFGVFLHNPELAVTPGPVTHGHSKAVGDCRNCHEPFNNNHSEKCLACHKADSIGLLTTTGEKIVRLDETFVAEKKPGAKVDHRMLANADCGSCHSEHRGPEASSNLKAFSHKSSKVTGNCAGCHQSPADKYHNFTAAKPDCTSCHNTGSWKAAFNHANAGKNCETCHKAPSNTIHKNAKDCAGCHSAGAVLSWKADFNHDKYFRFGKRHKAACKTCHPDNYSSYTCYGCHAHSPRGVAREHREEGIRDYNNCVKCHRSSSEREAKKLWRSQKKSSGTSRTRHDDDD